MSEQNSEKINEIKQYVKSYPDFPKQGILFRDVFSVLTEPKIFSLLREVLTSYTRTIVPSVECVTALESRGFLFGPILALDLGVPFVPIRKKGKLPGHIEAVSYTLEYGTDIIEIQSESIKRGTNVLVVDDLLATGGSLNAACKLIHKLEAEVVCCLVVIELVELEGRAKINEPVHSLLQY